MKFKISRKIINAKNLISITTIIWALFQLALPSFLILDSIKIRAIHLAFALFLAFLILPFRKKRKKVSKDIDEKRRIPFLDYLLAVGGAISALYIMLDWGGIALRSGTPNSMDIFMGLLVVVLLLEAARRSIGPALSIIVLVYTIYPL